MHEEDVDSRLPALEQGTLTRLGCRGAWPGAERAVFLDTETTGLSGGAGTVAFMIGFGFLAGGHFRVEQYMMRSYADEPLLIAKAAEILARFDAVVTFNGDNFDLPLLESRFTMCRMREAWRGVGTGWNLMHPARRLWKRRLGSCRLEALEREILRRGRTDDLPGSEAPKRFFEAMKTGDFAPLGSGAGPQPAGRDRAVRAPLRAGRGLSGAWPSDRGRRPVLHGPGCWKSVASTTTRGAATSPPQNPRRF